MKSIVKLAVAVVLLWCGAWALDVPGAYEQLGRGLEEDRVALAALSEQEYFAPHRAEIAAFGAKLAEAFALGAKINAAGEGDAPPGRDYLKRLRALQTEQRQLERLYVTALRHAMEHDDRPLFETLLEHPLEPLQNRHILEAVETYYTPRRQSWHCAAAERLLKEKAFVAENRAAYIEALRAYETRAEVELADASKKRLLKRFNNILLYALPDAQGYTLYAENANRYSVTLHIAFINARNVAFGGSKSVTLELAAGKEGALRTVTPLDRRTGISFGYTLRMAMGTLSARHDDGITYRLPFASGSRVVVSQGYGGRATHHGRSTFAVDFAVPVGTPVYAARSGRVVAAEWKHNRSGTDESYLKEANYVLIEHADHTFAQYAHLKPGGVVVKVGQSVERGTLIGYSGNTGFSSGPHLHFEVMQLDDMSTGAMRSVPVRFNAGGSIMTRPVKGKTYTVAL